MLGVCILVKSYVFGVVLFLTADGRDEDYSHSSFTLPEILRICPFPCQQLIRSHPGALIFIIAFLFSSSTSLFWSSRGPKTEGMNTHEQTAPLQHHWRVEHCPHSLRCTVWQSETACHGLPSIYSLGNSRHAFHARKLNNIPWAFTLFYIKDELLPFLSPRNMNSTSVHV